MGLRDIFDSLKKKNEAYKELEIEDKARNKLETRKLSANERALNKILEDRRQEAIKKELSKYEKKESKDYWHKDVIAQKNLFVGNKKLFAQKGGNI